MSYLEISKGKSIRIDSIIAVEASEELGSIIYTPSGPFTSVLSYNVILELIGRYEARDNSHVSNLNAVLKRVGHFAG